MRAILVEQPGGLERLEMREVPEPSLGPEDLLIRVAYAGCNWSDIQKRQGVYPDPVTFPAIIGVEVSGHVAAMGPGVKGFAIGDRVAAITWPSGLGGYAEFVSVPTRYAIPLPRPISLELGAAFPVVALTAYHLLYSAHRVRKGETILVHAVGGAVGLMLTQIACAAGARVVGTVGARGKGRRARDYGAMRVVERDREDFVEAALEATGGKGVDLVIDSLGGDVLPRSFDALRVYGRIINIGEAAGYPDFPIRPKLYERSTSLAGFELVHARPGSARWRRGVRYVTDGFAHGRLELPIVEVYPLARARDAHRRLERRGVSGKLLLRVSRDRR